MNKYITQAIVALTITASSAVYANDIQEMYETNSSSANCRSRETLYNCTNGRNLCVDTDMYLEAIRSCSQGGEPYRQCMDIRLGCRW